MAQEIAKPTFQDWIDTQEYRGDLLAAKLEWNLSRGVDFSIPDVDWNDDIFKIPQELLELIKHPPKRPTIEDITERKFGGKGIFDAFMESAANHLHEEYKAGRIQGAEYTQAWISTMQNSLQQAVAFALGRDKTFWEMLLANINAITALIGIYTARVQLAIAQSQVHQSRVNYCLGKLKLSTEDANFGLVIENMESARAQTLDTRLSDNKSVVGAIGKQKDLYSQQITSFKRNDEIKLLTQVIQVWVAQKTVDEGTTPPDAATNPAISDIISKCNKNTFN